MKALSGRRWRDWSQSWVSASALGVIVLFSACSTEPTTAYRDQLNHLIALREYPAALKDVQDHKDSEYGPKSVVLYHLDEGTILNNGNQYKESDQKFADAEHTMQDLYTKSILQAGGMLLLNDTTMDYAGEPFERVLLHVFRAMNWIFMGHPHGAAVEANKAEFFLQQLHDHYGDKLGYKDDAFVRYLDAMLYADIGDLNDARISLEAAKRAYLWYASYYNTPQPEFHFPKNARKDGDGELVFIHYNGVAPIKISKTIQVAWNQAVLAVQESNDTSRDSQRAKNALVAGFVGNAITVAYPQYVQPRYQIASSEVFVDSKLAGETVLMEDVSAIAFKNLKNRMDMIMARAIARAAIKYILAHAASQAVGKQFGQGWGLLTQVGSNIIAAATEVADTRSWTTLPSQIRMARIKVPPGIHTVRVDFKDQAGDVVESHVFPDVRIKKFTRSYLAFRTAL